MDQQRRRRGLMTKPPRAEMADRVEEGARYMRDQSAPLQDREGIEVPVSLSWALAVVVACAVLIAVLVILAAVMR